jgi:hypothetical protein
MDSLRVPSLRFLALISGLLADEKWDDPIFHFTHSAWYSGEPSACFIVWYFLGRGTSVPGSLLIGEPPSRISGLSSLIFWSVDGRDSSLLALLVRHLGALSSTYRLFN